MMFSTEANIIMTFKRYIYVIGISRGIYYDVVLRHISLSHLRGIYM
jgi:hypothetical protein